MSMSTFALWLAACLVVAWALVALPVLVLYLIWWSRRDEEREAPPELHAFDDMDPEALISIDNRRRARALSETGHLPPRLQPTPSTASSPPPSPANKHAGSALATRLHVCAFEDCQ